MTIEIRNWTLGDRVTNGTITGRIAEFNPRYIVVRDDAQTTHMVTRSELIENWRFADDT